MTPVAALPLALVVAVALFFLGMGGVALQSPDRIVGRFGIALPGRDARNEVRAVYGGFGIAVGLLLLASPWLPDLRAGVLVGVAIALVGMAVGRLASVLVEGSPGFSPWLFFAVELGLAGALALALRLGGG